MDEGGGGGKSKMGRRGWMKEGEEGRVRWGGGDG